MKHYLGNSQTFAQYLTFLKCYVTKMIDKTLLHS